MTRNNPWNKRGEFGNISKPDQKTIFYIVEEVLTRYEESLPLDEINGQWSDNKLLNGHIYLMPAFSSRLAILPAEAMISILWEIEHQVALKRSIIS